MITSVNTVICQTSDMDRSVAFYRDVLGLTPGHTSPYWSDFKVGDTRIGIHPPFEGSQPPFATQGKGWVLGLATDDIRGLRAKLEAAGAAITGDWHDTPSGVIFEFLDPDGHTLQAIQLGLFTKDL